MQVERTKKSFGLAVGRWSPAGYQMLLVQKRYTHAFVDFIHAHYSVKTAARDIFARCTHQELLLIRSLDFGMMWYNVWLNAPRDAGGYADKLARFQANWMGDRGRGLIALLDSVEARGEPPWEFPKGKPEGAESPLGCARREFSEETQLGDDYRVFPYTVFRRTETAGRTRYETYFFAGVAPAVGHGAPRDVPIRHCHENQIAEVAKVRWMTYVEIDHVAPELGGIARRVARFCRARARGKPGRPVVVPPVIRYVPPKNFAPGLCDRDVIVRRLARAIGGFAPEVAANGRWAAARRKRWRNPDKW